MKNLFLIFIALVVFACAPGTTPTTSKSTTAGETSPEAEARSLTAKMKTILNLDATQEDKVLMINVVNKKILKRLRENNETDKISSTKETFHGELKNVLTEEQFAKFLVEFPEL